MSRTESYRCQIARDADGRITAITVQARDLEQHERQIHVVGRRAAHVAGAVQMVIRTDEGRGRQWTQPAPFDLDPVLGAQVELLLRAVKPLRRLDRVESVSEGVAQMSREESAYWHAQTARRRGLRALRVLLEAVHR